MSPESFRGSPESFQAKCRRQETRQNMTEPNNCKIIFDDIMIVCGIVGHNAGRGTNVVW